MKSNRADSVQDLAMLLSCFTGWVVIRELPKEHALNREFSPAMAECEFD